MLDENGFNRYVINELSNFSLTSVQIHHAGAHNVFNTVNTGLNAACFPKITRDKGHRPDLIIVNAGSTKLIETKSPKEISEVCRYSNAHILSYLLQTIYGQCSSYYFLYVHGKPQTSFWLALPSVVQFTNNIQMQDYLDIIIDMEQRNHTEKHKSVMGIVSVIFSRPRVLPGTVGQKYHHTLPGAQTSTFPGMLVTEIKYTI